MAHLPLLNTNMPANVHYLLNKYLNLVRWYDKNFVNLIESVLPWTFLPLSQYDIEADALHPLLDACGYKHPFINSMLLIMAAIGLIAVFWLLSAFKDILGCASRTDNSCCKKRHGKWFNNFALRFIYEFFLTFCIVIFINISVVKLSEPTPTFSYIVTVALSILLSGICLFLLTRLCCNGPYVSGFYKKGTALSQKWGRRTLNPNFDAKAYLESKRKEQKATF